MTNHKVEHSPRIYFDGDPSHFEKAHRLILPYITSTPCPRFESLSNEVGADVFMKLENKQTSGSFKIRGVTHKILSLCDVDKRKTLIAASTGNHGAAFAYMLNKLNLKGKLFVPHSITKVKLEALQAAGVPLEIVGEDCVQTEGHAIDYAKASGCVFVAPYNDPHVVLGQGTISLELLAQLNYLDAVFVPVGGGGLIAGIAAYIKLIAPRTRIIGCQPVHSAIMYHSLQAGQILSMDCLPSISDATAGGIEPGSITFDLCRKYVDDFVLLTEQEIGSAIRLIWQREHMVIEGGAALGIAALRKTRDQYKGSRIALIISGGKIGYSQLKKLGCVPKT